jgi:hypothetical protein
MAPERTSSLSRLASSQRSFQIIERAPCRFLRVGATRILGLVIFLVLGIVTVLIILLLPMSAVMMVGVLRLANPGLGHFKAVILELLVVLGPFSLVHTLSTEVEEGQHGEGANDDNATFESYCQFNVPLHVSTEEAAGLYLTQ